MQNSNWCHFRSRVYLPFLVLVAVFLAGCPKGNRDYNAGRRAEELQDYDTALVHYEQALRADPTNVEYKLRALNMRFQDGQYHLEQGEKDLKKGQLELALAEFQRAAAVDPSNAAAGQEIKHTMQLLEAKAAASTPKAVNPQSENYSNLLTAPPKLKPISRQPINLKMTNDARVVYETIAKLAGLSVIFDPNFTSRRISVELPNVTLEQALDDVSLECNAFWKPVGSSVILVAPNNPQKRRELEDEEVRTFYLSNTLTPQNLTEIVTGLRQLLDLRRVSQMNSQDAIVIRSTPAKLILASKIISDIDKAKPEVLIHVEVLSASVNRLRDLGILPGQSAVLTFTPQASNQPGGSSSSSSSGSSSTGQITLNNLKNISLSDYALTLPGATANAILTDNNTKIIQNPEIRVTDGEKATLKIGDRVPVATGSFQAGVGVGTGGGAGIVNPLVNTQFQYIDVGVNIDVTPHVHPDGDVSMNLSVEVSSITGSSNIGGINQPIISQRKIGPDEIRLKNGEVSVLGGLFQTTRTKNLNGIPGLARLPFFRYLFSDNSTQTQENEILIVLTPHVIRFPSITAANLRTLAAGTDTNIRVYTKEDEPSAASTSTAPVLPSATAKPNIPPASKRAAPASNGSAAVQLHFAPASTTLKVGSTETLGLTISNVKDLFSIPLLIHYNPAVIQVEQVQHGGFLGGGNQEIAIVQRIDQQRGEVVVSATREPNTPGISGSGTLLEFVVRGVARGTSALQILQVNARDSKQHAIPMVSGEATVHVQ